jgi:hypothetical protein
MLQEGSFASQTRRPVFSLEAIPPRSEHFAPVIFISPHRWDGRRFARADTTREFTEAQDAPELRIHVGLALFKQRRRNAFS